MLASFVQTTDPALDTPNQVLAGKIWIDTSGGGWVWKRRSADNTAWITKAESTGGTIADGSVTTLKIADKNVTLPKLPDLNPQSLVGRGAGSGSPQNILLGSNLSVDATGVLHAAGTSSAIADGSVTTAKIADRAATFAKIQDIAANKLLGRAGIAGAIQEIILGTNLTLDSATSTLNAAGGASGGTYNTTVQGGNLVATSGYTTLEAAFTAIGTAPTTLMVNSVVPVSTDLAQPSNIVLFFVGGGRVNKTGAGKLSALNFTCDDEYQICFTGFTPGDLKFGLKMPSELSPCWFGAQAMTTYDPAAYAQNTDILPVVNLIMASFRRQVQDYSYQGTIIRFPTGDFYFSDEVVIKKALSIRGTGQSVFWAQGTRFYFPKGKNGFIISADYQNNFERQRATGNVYKDFEIRSDPTYYTDSNVNIVGQTLEYASGRDFSQPVTDGTCVTLDNGKMTVVVRRRRVYAAAAAQGATTTLRSSIPLFNLNGYNDAGADVHLLPFNFSAKIISVTDQFTAVLNTALPAAIITDPNNAARNDQTIYVTNARSVDYDKPQFVAYANSGYEWLAPNASAINTGNLIVGQPVKIYVNGTVQDRTILAFNASEGEGGSNLYPTNGVKLSAPLDAASFTGKVSVLAIVQSLKPTSGTSIPVRLNTAAGITGNFAAGSVFENIRVIGFAGDGVKMETNRFLLDYNMNNNIMIFRNMLIESNAGHGYHGLGSDSNVITFEQPNIIGNRGYNIWDGGYLGITIIGGHISDGVSGSVNTALSDTNTSVLTGVYYEYGEPPLELGNGSISIGGSNGIGYHPLFSSGVGIDGGDVSRGAVLSGGGLVTRSADGTMSAKFIGSGKTGEQKNLFLRVGGQGGRGSDSSNYITDWGMGNGDLGTLGYISDISGAGGWIAAWSASARAFITRTLRISDASGDYTKYTQMTSADSVPTGTYPKGAIVWNRNPVSGGTAGWINIGNATTANWQTFGTIGTSSTTTTTTSTSTATTGTLGTLVSRFNFGSAAVAGWTTVGQGAGGFVNFQGAGDYTDTVDVNTQTGAVDVAVYKTLLYKSNDASATSFTIPALTAGAFYVARVHVWMPAGFNPSGSHAWNIDVNGGTAKPVTTQPNQLRIIDIPFTGGSANVLNFSANTGGAYKVANALEIYNAA